MHVEPLEICRISVCPAESLTGLAHELGIKLSMASALKRIWQRKFSGKCCLCGCKSKGHLCGKCKTRSTGTLLDNRRPRTLLKKVEASTIVLRADCECGQKIDVRAGDLLNQFRKYGTIVHKKTLCKQCFRTLMKKRYPPAPRESKTIEIPDKKRVPLSPEVRYYDLPTQHLMFKPFVSLKRKCV